MKTTIRTVLFLVATVFLTTACQHANVPVAGPSPGQNALPMAPAAPAAAVRVDPLKNDPGK